MIARSPGARKADAWRRRILIGSLDVVPSFHEDQEQPGVGWPLFEMTLQNGNAPVILRGNLRENRAWCLVPGAGVCRGVRELASREACGYSVSFEPFTLWERRGG